MSLLWTFLSALVGAIAVAMVALGVRMFRLEERADRFPDRLKRASRSRRYLVTSAAIGAATAVALLILLGAGAEPAPEIARDAGLVSAIPLPGADERERVGGPSNPCFDFRVRASTRFTGNNPLPHSGNPHGSGISHVDYPSGYALDGRPRPSFNNYIDYSDSAPNDERPFLGARALGRDPCPADSFETRRKIQVFPGDVVLVSLYIHNNGPTGHNDGGDGPSVARDTRVGVDFPYEPDTEVQMSAWLFADNAVVNDRYPSLHTISDNLSFLSRGGTAISLRYVKGSARLLQSRQSRLPSSINYQAWAFTPEQAHWLFTAEQEVGEGGENLDSETGLAVGNDGSFDPTHSVGTESDAELGWFGSNVYHGYLAFKVRVERARTLLEG